MSDYKNTLNLPQTDFPMKASLAQREPVQIQAWESMDIYARLRAANIGRKKFVLHIGPPYANGHLHLGHAVNGILKDMIVKSKTLSGFDSPLVPGWDCHGLPIELNVEKKVGKPGQKVTAEEFRAACREYAESFIAIQRDEFKRLGMVADWANPYRTMDPAYEANIVRSLAKMVANKHLQKGYKPVHWCLDCASALAEAEVEYAEKKSQSIDVRFRVIDQDALMACFAGVEKGSGPVSVLIWTTTPWTLPANEAVCLNPMLDYVLIACPGDERYIVAEALLPALMQRYKIDDYQVLGKVRGEALAGILLQHPLFDKQVPIILGDHVTVEDGTGAVHTAPAHGPDDFVIGKRYGLPVVNPVGDDGCYTAVTPLFAGMHVSKAEAKILETLKEHNVLMYQSTLTHSYPHCWRHKTPVIFRATPQWFISMEQNNLREQALAAITRVEWIPDWGQSRIAGMIEKRPDWCISRQRTWGVPLCLFVHKQTGELHPDTVAIMEKVALRMEKEGIEAWHRLAANEVMGAEADEYRKINDTLDVWFDSGVSHECVLKARPELTFPTDIVLEGSDQHRGWFQSSLLSSVAINGVESYREVLTHGFVVDGQGRKMSKSIGNVIAPEEVVKTLGADVLRLWVASVDYRAEIAASKEILTRTSETYRRIRNTARFFLANLHEFNPATDLVKPEEMVMLDRWAVDQARRVQQEIIAAFDAYQFHVIVQKLHNFCVIDMGGFYLDVIKDRQYTLPKNSLARRSAQTALYHIAQAFVRWLTPILTFTAEEIWQYMPGEKQDSVLLTEWYDQLAALSDDEVMNAAYWEKIRAVRDAVNKEIEAHRNAGKLGSALEAEVNLYCGAQMKQMLDHLQAELRFILITSSATVIAEHSGPVDTVVTDVAGLALKITATTNEKCERCWHRVSDVNTHAEYPGLCGRCVANVECQEEVRAYV